MSSRRPAFDPSRLDDLDELLPPPPSPPADHPVPAHSSGTQTDSEGAPDDRRSTNDHGEGQDRAATSPPAAGNRSRKARGQGGRPSAGSRPAAEEAHESTRVPVAVRIPRSLYEELNTRLLTGPERPSYGQLAIWTCEDHPDKVASEVRTARPAAGTRRPRGRRLAADTVQVTLRLTPEERGLLDDIADAVREIQPGLVTRTEVATAALRLALANPPAL
jgi:hypothetical protein